jgi:hypothetical protein
MTDDELREIHEAIELATAESRRAYSFSGGSSYAYASMVACLRAHRVITAVAERRKALGAEVDQQLELEELARGDLVNAPL